MHVLEADVAVGPRASLVLPPEVHPLPLLRGVAAPELDGAPLAVVCDEPEAPLPDFFTSVLAPVVSRRMIEALLALGVDNFETFEVVIEDLGGERPPTGHVVLNVVGRVACIDLDRSEYTAFEGAPFKLEAMRLGPLPPRDLAMLRPDEWPLVILVSDRVAAGLRASGLTGLKLTGVLRS